jgi:hypothetical protein
VHAGTREREGNKKRERERESDGIIHTVSRLQAPPSPIHAFFGGSSSYNMYTLFYGL